MSEDFAVPHIIILNGPAGVGKTTVGRLLAGLVPNGACVHGDMFKEFIVSRIDGQVAGGLAYVNGATVAANFLRAGYRRVVFEFVFEQPKFVARFLDALPIQVPIFLYTLWAPLEVVVTRESNRVGRERLGDRVIECHHLMTQSLAELGTIVENVNVSAEQTAQYIHTLREDGIGRIETMYG